MEKIRDQILKAENELITALGSRDLLRGVSMHLDSPEYRNIWDGEVKTYEMLQARIKMGIERGLKSISYDVSSRDFIFINSDNVLETLSATETSTMKDGTSSTSGVAAISILWQRIENRWRLGYLHASELPKE